MAEWLSVMHQTPGGAFVPHNVPRYLAPLTKQTLLDSRAQGQQGFNAYRQAVGLPALTRRASCPQGPCQDAYADARSVALPRHRHVAASATDACACSFEQLGLGANMTATLSRLYHGNIDALELPVGVMIEQTQDQGLVNFYGEVCSRDAASSMTWAPSGD